MVLEDAIPIAKEEGVSTATICLAWLLAKAVATSVIMREADGSIAGESGYCRVCAQCR